MEAAVFPRGGAFGGCRAPKEAGEERVPWCADPASFGGRMAAVEDADGAFFTASATAAAGGCGGRRKRRRRRREVRMKNEEKAENQRMNHIAVERNRRKQMNDYLAVLQSLMPPSYAARGDQASIVGGAINFVKDLQQLLQSLEARKRILAAAGTSPPPSDAGRGREYEGAAESREAASGGVVEVVSLVERHANLKVVAQRRPPRQLLRMVAGLQSLRLTPLHLNLTSAADMTFYSFNLKVEDDCQLTSMDDIASAVNRMVWNIQEEEDA